MKYATLRRGHTLLELVLSLTLLGIVMVSVSSAVMFAAQATPGDDSPTATVVRDAIVLDQIAEDLALAIYVTEQSSNAVTVVVADRTGDGLPDRIRYAWSGAAGDPLTYAINSSPAIILLQSVNQFTLAYSTQTTTRQHTGAITAGSETELDAYTSSLLATYNDVTITQWFGESLSPGLSGSAVGFVPTRIRVYARESGSLDGVLLAEVGSATGGRPDGVDTYARGTVNESLLDEDGDWISINFSETRPVDRDQSVAFVAGHLSGSNVIARLRSSPTLGGGFLYSNNGGTTWGSDTTKSMLYRLYGRELTQADGYSTTRTHITHIEVGVEGSSNGRALLSRKVRMLQAPAIYSIYRAADFNADPTLLDLNGDSVADWYYTGGAFPTGALSNGVWTAGNLLRVASTGVFNGDVVVTVEARMRSTNGEGPAIYGPFTVDGSGMMLPLITRLRQDGAGGQELLIYNELTPGTPVARVAGLAQGWVDLRLTLLPEQEYLSITVNGEDAGAVALSRVTNSGMLQTIALVPAGADAQFADVRVHVGGTYVRDSSGSGGLLGGLLDLLF